MSELSTNYTYQDLELDTIQEYFGDELTLDDFATMSEDERAAYFEAELAKLASDLSIDEFEELKTEFAEDLETELYEYSALIAAEQNDLEALLNSDSVPSIDKIAIQNIMDELAEWQILCDNDIINDFDDAFQTYQDKHVILEAGTTHTFDPSNPENGDEFFIDATAVGSDDTTSAFNNETSGMVDLDGDGYFETDADVNNDGVADADFNEDSIIDETDMLVGHNQTSATTITLELEADETLSIDSYDEATNTARFKITNAEGDVYFVTITGDVEIYTKTIPDNLETIEGAQNLLARMREDAGDEHTLHYFAYGVELDATEDVYTIVDMSLMPENTYTTSPTTEDFLAGREYTLDMTSGTTDTLNFNFPADAEIEFMDSETNQIIMQVTTASGTITITIKGLEAGVNADAISINGGSIVEDASLTFHPFNLPSIEIFDETGNVIASGTSMTTATMITLNGDTLVDLI